MRNDAANSQGPAFRRGRGSGFFPTSLRVISSCLKSVSGSATSIASTVCSAGASVASSINRAEEDDREREQVQWAGFDKLELGAGNICHVLLLTYKTGFQVWDVEEADDVRELVSKRDGSVAFLRVQPQPITSVPADGGFKASRPLLLVVTEDGTFNGGNVQSVFGTGYNGGSGSPPQTGSIDSVPTVVQFYSFRSHTYVHSLRFRSAIYAVRCSTRIVAVALATQIYCFDAATLKNTFSVLTHPIPHGGQGRGGVNIGYGPMDVGPRWLVYAANHALVQNTGRASPQHLTPSPGISLSTSLANGNIVAHYAKQSSKQIAAGIVTLGDMGYKKLTRYSDHLPDDGSSLGPGSISWKNNSNAFAGHPYEPEHSGTVIVRDFVSKIVVAQFRAHNSPLSALCFDPTGTVLVTASVHGHSLNVYRIMPSPLENNLRSTVVDMNTSCVHLYKLNRGLTNAVIQDISFSDDSHWIAVSTSRGTSHLFAISPFGGVVGVHTHGGGLGDGSVRSALVPSLTFPWWSSSEPLKINQQALPPPPTPINLSVVSRIKNGNNGWHNSVNGAAAVATGKMKSPGAVAVLFHNGCGSLESDLGNSILKDQLWVFSPSGHLIRYALGPAGAEAVYCSNSTGMRVGSCGTSQVQDLRVVVQPLQKWDIGRKLYWVEREENIQNFGRGTVTEEISIGGFAGYRNRTILSHHVGCEMSGKEDIMTEEKHRSYISNAEMQMHQGRLPVWAKSEMYFYAMMSNTSNEDSNDKGGRGGETEIEKIPTRLVEVRKTDLVPVFEPRQNFKLSQQARGPIADVPSGVSALQVHQVKDDCMQDVGVRVDCVQRGFSSSGSSCGSEGVFFGGQPAVLNGFHHASKDSEEHMVSVFCSSPEPAFACYPPHGPMPSEREETVAYLTKINFPNQDRNGKCTSQTEDHMTNGSPSTDISRGGKGDACKMQALENYLRVNGSAKSLTMHEFGFNGKHPAKQDIGGSVGLISGGDVVDGSVSEEGLPMKQGLSCDDDSNSCGMDHWAVDAEAKTDSPFPKKYDESISTHHMHDEHGHHVNATRGREHLGITSLDENEIVKNLEGTYAQSKCVDRRG